MTGITLLLLAAVAVASVQSDHVRYDNYKLYGVPVNTEADYEKLQHFDLGSDITMWNQIRVGGTADMMVAPHRADEFEEFIVRMGLNNTLKIRNVQELIDNERKTVAAKSDTFGWTQYHTYDQIYSWLDSLVANYSSVLSKIEIGKSYEGRLIHAVKLSHKAGNPAIFIEANIHAREWVTSATATWVLNELLTSTNETVQEIARNIDWYIVPVLNVDGFVFTHEKNRVWRKTRQPTSMFCHGADPNRNFNREWRLKYNGASDNPCSDTFAGHSAESEPEIAAFTRFYETIASSIKLYISLHAYGQKLLTPYGHTNILPENHYDIMDIGLAAKDAIMLRDGRDYEVGPIAEVMYPSSGSSIDWVYGRQGLRLAYAFECRDRSNGNDGGFLLPANQIVPNSLEIFDGVKAMIAQARVLKYI